MSKKDTKKLKDEKVEKNENLSDNLADNLAEFKNSKDFVMPPLLKNDFLDLLKKS